MFSCAALSLIYALRIADLLASWLFSACRCVTNYMNESTFTQRFTIHAQQADIKHLLQSNIICCRQCYIQTEGIFWGPQMANSAQGLAQVG